MFASVKWCAERIDQPCRLTKSQFKVTGLSLEFCVHSVSSLPLGGFSLNFGQMFTSVGQCAEPIIQPCGLRSRSQLKVTSLSLEFGVGSISPLPLEGFSLNSSQMFASVRWCAEPITQVCWLKVKVTIEGHQYEPWILRPLHCHSDCLVKFGSDVCLVRWCVEHLTQQCRLKVKVTTEGHPSLSCLLHISWTL